MPLKEEFYGHGDGLGANMGLNYHMKPVAIHERSSSNSFTMFTSSPNVKYGYDIFNMNIYNESGNEVDISVFIGTAAFTTGSGAYLCYKVRVPVYGSYSPVTTDSRIFVHDGIAIYIQKSGTATMNYTLCANRFRSPA
tara:strand:- start:63 stop:476 length:414 start_codon:yes stop_codon:yes gene_type:complete